MNAPLTDDRALEIRVAKAAGWSVKSLIHAGENGVWGFLYNPAGSRVGQLMDDENALWDGAPRYLSDSLAAMELYEAGLKRWEEATVESTVGTTTGHYVMLGSIGRWDKDLKRAIALSFLAADETEKAAAIQ